MSESTNKNESERDPFYVGYLPLPAPIKRFIVPWVVGNLVLAIGMAAVVASQHREPGSGTWNTASSQTIRGYLQKDPYPIFKSDHAGTFILVEQGKIGAQQRVADLREGSCVVTGFVIQREGRKVLELDPTVQHPIAFVNGSLYRFDEPLDLGLHTLRGEIVDPKCYLGVMQPGEGKTHKTCATLCITGGIPPMLLVRDRQGNTAAYLVTDEAGKPFPASHYEYIADPIEVTGRVLRDGDLLILRADLDSIRRLDASGQAVP